jgi:YD repeat-containing protein
LTDVWEIRAADSATESISFPNHAEVTAGYRSKYVYDALDDLLTVTQQVGTGGYAQTRSFVYDPLKRLTSATNPESGQITYLYDNNGNLTSKTDARNITTTLTYDALNRPTSKTYSDTTPRVDFYYDNQSLPAGAPSYSRGSSIGRLVAVTYGGGSLGNYFGYDSLGRVTVKYQRLGTTNYQVQAAYNKASVMTSETYPSGRTVSYAYDQAGRLTSFSGTLGDGLSRTYATITQYSAAGLKERESYGTGANGMTTPLYLKLHYNKRQQMVDLRLGSVNDEWNWNRGALIFYYGTNAVNNWNPFQDDADNNGNVRRALHYVPTNDQISSYVIPMLQDYTYDALNRIASVSESYQNESGTWTLSYLSQSFGYDRWGNRWISSATGGVNSYNDQATNRINGLGYDAAGNITSDALSGGTMSYDAENRLLTASSGGTYVYDGEGKRVKRLTGGQEWWYIYGLGGELLAEYLSSAPTTVKKEYGYRAGQLLVVWNGDESTADKKLKWLVTDHLGSTRLEADKSGGLGGMVRHDYLPFDEELTAGLRSNPQYGYKRLGRMSDKLSDFEQAIQTTKAIGPGE